MPSIFDDIRRLWRPGRTPRVPKRDTLVFPALNQYGQVQTGKRVVYRPTPRNLRMFGRTPYARRAINTIKNPISMLDWEVVPRENVTLSNELARQCQIVRECFENPNDDDNWELFIQQVLEDYLHGAGAFEQQVSSDPMRPIWLWPVDGLTIQVYPAWAGGFNEARYLQTLGYGAFGRMQGDAGVQLRNDELVYMRPNPSTPSPFGFGPIEVAFNAIARLLSTGEFAGNVASNQRPSVMLDLGDGADSDAVKAFRAFWRNEVEGQGQMPITATGSNGSADSKTRGPSVLRLYPEGDAGLFLQYQEFLKREIASAFDISPQNLGIEREVNRSTADSATDRDWDHAIIPAARAIAGHLNREVIQGALGFSGIKFKFKGLDREDETSTMEILTGYVKNNVFTPNMALRKLGMAPQEGPWGDKLDVDMRIAEQAARAAAQPAEEPQLGNAEPKPSGSSNVPADKPKTTKENS